ncbi:MAG: hypothetical protein HZA01_10560 [Nitrospinae bacterium]|nr:hypothetical protein [Nitrospinota bacterium]
MLYIINDTVSYSNQLLSDGKKGINNYHIWWYFVKIIHNLPPEVITEDLPIDDWNKNGKIHHGFRSLLLAMMDPSLGSNWNVTDITRKLLPKFLEDAYTAEYAETIIDVITRIKEGTTETSLSGREEVVLLWKPYWILDAFERNHEKIAKRCSSKIIFNIADKLKNALSYKQQCYAVPIEIDNHRYQIKVLRVPIKEKDAETTFKEEEYQCIIGQFTADQIENTDNEKEPFSLHYTDAAIILGDFKFSADSRNAFISEIKDKLPPELNLAGTEVINKRINNLYDELNSDYCYIWLKSLADGGRKHLSRAEEVLIIILRDVLLSKCKLDSAAGKEILEKFLTGQYPFPTFRRFVLLCMDKFWNEYKSLLTKFIKVVPKALDESDYKVELFDLLKNHHQDFEPSIIEKLKELIYNVPRYYQEKGERMIAYWKYQWLAALKDHAYFKDAYEEAREKVEPMDGKDYAPDRETIKGGVVTHYSPISKEELLKKPIPEIVRYLKEFKGADFWERSFEGKPSKEGLAETLQSAVKEDPQKFADELKAFLDTSPYYLHRIFRAFKDAWNEGKEIDWEKIFDFCVTYFDQDKEKLLNESLKAQGEDSGEGKYIWIVEDIVDLIADGSKDDKRAFEPEYFPKAEKIFELVYLLLKGEHHPDTQRDALNYALNTTLGRTVMSYVSFSLRVARATGKKEPDWGKNKFERFFEKGIETTIWLGSYLPQINYLDESYAREKINAFADKTTDDFEWRMFMEGYLFGGAIYENIYHLMRGNYEKALESSGFEDREDERLAGHISFGHLYYGEALEATNADGKPSLFRKMLNEAKSVNRRNRWTNVVIFFWKKSGRKSDTEKEEERLKEVKEKALAFWQWTYEEQEFVQDQLGDQYLDFLGELSRLTVFPDKIGEKEANWLLLCAPHIDRHHNSDFFIEYLAMFTDEESVKRTGKIFLKALEGCTPAFRQEEIQLLMDRIYKLAGKNSDAELKKDADEICNTYGRRGVHFLKELFHRYNL